MSQKLDMILFGASGFTGIRAIPYMIRFAKTETRQLSWGIAGRSERKLKKVLDDYSKQIGACLNNIPIIVADAQNEETIKNMVRKARIIINCIGPYYLYGEVVVKACVEEGTHYVDVNAEIYFFEKMQLKYHKKAQEKQVYIIGACGYESIPADLGVVCLQQNFKGTLNSVEIYFEYLEDRNASKTGSLMSYTSWESMINTLSKKQETAKIYEELFPKSLPVFRPQLKLKVIPHKPDVVDGWAMLLGFISSFMINRTQRYLYERDSQRPVQAQTYRIIKSFLGVILQYAFGLLIVTLCQFHFGRRVVLRNPEIFTLANIRRQSPSEERVDNSYFTITFYCKGWNEILPDPNDQFTTAPDKVLIAKMSGSRPGYGLTNVCLVLAAITVITETDKMPSQGGVYPPGYAFANTTLMKQLTKNGLNFNILGGKDLQFKQ